MTLTDRKIRAALIDLALRRGSTKTICPSEAARALSSDWRPLMPAIRRVAAEMVAEGALQATQRGRKVDLAIARGPIRLSLTADQGTGRKATAHSEAT